MITLPVKYLRVLLVAVSSLRKAKAFNANMFRHVQLGYKEDAVLYENLKQLEKQIQDLVLEVQREKRKTFCISLYPVDFE